MAFPKKAKNYDNELREKQSQTIAEKIMNIIGGKQNYIIVEYGCATGLISFHFHDRFKK